MDKKFANKAVEFAGMEQLTDQFMRNLIGNDKKSPGGVVAIVKDNQIALKKGYGFTSNEAKTAVNPERTLFRIGSVTKTFTAAAILQLVQDNKIDLKSDIQNYFDDIRITNPFSSPVTVHHLLTHTSGFKFTPDSEPSEDLHTTISLKEYIKQKEFIVLKEPGSSYMYDNNAYNLLGYLIEQASGHSYAHYMQEYIFRPLGMTRTHCTLHDLHLADLAHGYLEDGTPIAPYSTVPSDLPAGGMLSTAEDMGHFMIAQLNNGIYQANHVWDKISLTQMHEYHSSIHPAYPDATYGYENWLKTGEKYGSHIVVKGGDIPGYSSFIVLMPEHKLGVFMAFNKLVSSAEVGRRWNKWFMNYFFADKQYLETSSVVETPQQQLKRFEGTYTDLRIFFAVSRITASNDGEITITDIAGERGLKQIDELLFQDGEGEILAFKEGKNGSIEYFKYRNPVSYSQKHVSSFTDVSASSAYAPYIESLEAMGILKGKSKMFFKPDDAMTRAEFAVLIARMLGVEPVEDLTPVFQDLNDHWSRREIEALAAMGIVAGVTGDRFDPERIINRREAADMLILAVQTALPFLIPENIDDIARTICLADELLLENAADANVKVLIGTGLTGPDTAETDEGILFRPSESISRQEAAVWICQLIKRYAQI